MSRAAIRHTLTFCLLSAFATAPLIAQAVAQTVVNPAPVAYVYVGTSKGINLYHAAFNRKLTLVAGSPFKTTGLMIGSNQKFFITLGTYWVRSYQVKANGAIGAQVSQINTQNYSGRDCGTTNGAVLDHSGQYVYVLLNVPPDGNNTCLAYQTYQIATSGQLTFRGATTHVTPAPAVRNLPRFLANNKFAYAINNFAEEDIGVEIFINGGSGFTRASNGALEYRNNFDFSFPPPYKGYDLAEWIPQAVTADPTNHLAVAMYPWYDPPKGRTFDPQLASYTVDSQGNIATNNTWETMPISDVFPTVLNMSPDGTILAVGGYGGMQVFHFNGGAPITRFSTVLTSDQVNWIRWDKVNGLYGLSTNGKLYVYMISTIIAVAPGSPYTVSGATGLFVVPK